MEYYAQLATLFEGEDGDLFKPKEKPKTTAPYDRWLDSLNQITAFVEKNHHVPNQNSDDIKEAMLGVQLAALRADKEKTAQLTAYDSLGLLQLDKAPESLDELFATDDALFSITKGIFDLDALPNRGRTYRNIGDIAKRRLTKNFHPFRALFVAQQNGLKTGTRKLTKFRTVSELKLHNFYIVDGIMCYVEHIGKQKTVFGRQKERLRVIFENGTESDMYLRTLSSELYRNGYVVVDNVAEKTDHEKIVGYIYVLRSLSDDPAITTIKNLYKVGVTADTVSERIKNAAIDPTYLMAPVEIVAQYQLTGAYQPVKVESLIHRFFADAKVEMQIIDKSGLPYTPDEWYSVPIAAIHEAVDRINDKSLADCYYDSTTQRVKEPKGAPSS